MKKGAEKRGEDGFGAAQPTFACKTGCDGCARDRVRVSVIAARTHKGCYCEVAAKQGGTTKLFNSRPCKQYRGGSFVFAPYNQRRSIMAQKDTLRQLILNKKDLFIRVNDEVWAHPEMGFVEFESAKIIKDALASEGFEIKSGLAGIDTAFSATWGSGRPVLGFLGEYDALPALSQQVCAQRNPVEDGANGHGCGHNALGAGTVAAVVGLKDYLSQHNLPGTIVYFGCPGEEFGTGKAFMAREGVFKDVDANLAWHPADHNFVVGSSYLANYCVLFHFTGTAAHAAACPHLGRSALDACELMNVGVNYLREHIIDSARVHYAYHDVGGPAPNVVQNTATLFYYIRAPRAAQAAEIFERIKKIAQGAALMTETTVDIRVKNACSDYIVNDTLGEVMAQCMEEIGDIPFSEEAKAFAKEMYATLTDADKSTIDSALAPYLNRDEIEQAKKDILCGKALGYKNLHNCISGSTDCGDASYNAPTVTLNSTTAILGTPGHSWQNTAQSGSVIAHEGLLYAGEVLALTALRLLENPELVKKANDELNAITGGKYTCLIPADVKPEP